MFKDFKDFILKGNAVDMAVGVLIGASFASLVKSIGDGILQPLIRAMGGDHEIALTIGIFDIGVILNAMISLLITGLILFYGIVKPIRKVQVQDEAKPASPPEPSNEEKLLSEIRDLLRMQKL